MRSPTAAPNRRASPAFCLPFLGIFFLWMRLNHRLLSSFSAPAFFSGHMNNDNQSSSSAVAPPWPGREAVTVHAPSRHNATVAICLIVRNETVYMDEWVDFHIALGFGPIFIYDNADAPDLVLQSWYERRRDVQHCVRITHMPLFPVQGHAYEQCLRHDAINNTFAAMIDIDEFVVLKKHDNIVDLMAEHCNEECGQLSLNWRPMGTSNETKYRPLPVTMRNVNVHTDWAMPIIVKAIVRPTYVADYMDWSHTVMLKRGHWVDTNGTILPRLISKAKCCNPHWHDGPTDVGQIYHYKFKSEEEFYVKLCERGDSLLPRGDMKKCAHMNKFGNYPRDGAAFDDLAWRQLKRMVPKYAIFDMMPDVSLY